MMVLFHIQSWMKVPVTEDVFTHVKLLVK